MMTPYRVEGGVFRIGVGELVAISDAQRKSRAHNLEIVEEAPDGSGCVARAKTTLEFKSGEVVGLAAPPPKIFAEIMHRLEGDDLKQAGERLAAEAKAADEKAAAAKTAAREKHAARAKRAGK